MSALNIAVHPAAEAFPMHSQDELNRLAIDIVQNGLQHPIVTTPAGELLDGRNRLAACRLVNVEPTFEVYDGDPWAYSRSVNLHSRSMTTGQRAASAALSLIAEGKRVNGRWARGSVPTDDDGATCKSTSWIEAMAHAGVIADWSHDLDLLLLVRDGSVALDAAYKRAKDRRDKAEWEAEQERKKREQEIAANDAALSHIISIAHAFINAEWALAEAAIDNDNWKGVISVMPKVITLATQIRGKAHEKLEG